MNFEYVESDVIGYGDFEEVSERIFVEKESERICILNQDRNGKAILITPEPGLKKKGALALFQA